MRISRIGLAAICAVLLLGATACSGNSGDTAPSAQQQAIQKAKDRKNYVPVHDVEGQNYNARQRLADNPSTLLWCSAYPTNPNVKPFTVPIVGKLTSGNKRPYSTSQAIIDTDTGGKTYSPELPGPDGFYGTSGEYRYGFDPAGNYHDFYNMETYCTSVPSVIQKNTTQIEISVAGDLNELDRKAEAALAACREANSDPSVSCDAAANLLGE